jgi:hypothetical protein
MKQPNEKIIENLFSSNVDIALETIETLHDTGDISYIPAIIELMLISEFAVVKDAAHKLLGELKQPDAIPYLIEGIESERNRPIKQQLLSVCWENGLDFTPNIGRFIEWMLEGDYMTAFEAFTVIENLDGSISSDDTEKYLKELRKGMETSMPEKAALFHDLIHFLPSLTK